MGRKIPEFVAISKKDFNKLVKSIEKIDFHTNEVKKILKLSYKRKQQLFNQEINERS